MSFFKGSEEVPQVDTHWISESGIIDVFVMLGPKPHDLFQEYAAFTGTTALPPVSLASLFYLALYQFSQLSQMISNFCLNSFLRIQCEIDFINWYPGPGC